VPTPAGLLRVDVRDGGREVEVDSPVPFVLDRVRREAGTHQVVRSCEKR
jgi:hypothetical protein